MVTIEIRTASLNRGAAFCSEPGPVLSLFPRMTGKARGGAEGVSAANHDVFEVIEGGEESLEDSVSLDATSVGSVKLPHICHLGGLGREEGLGGVGEEPSGVGERGQRRGLRAWSGVPRVAAGSPARVAKPGLGGLDECS